MFPLFHVAPCTSICAPHICQHCGFEVSARGLHDLNCKYSEGRHMQHSTLSICNTPPSAYATLHPQRHHTPLSFSCWGPLKVRAPCWSCSLMADTFAVSYRGQATTAAGCVVAHAEEKKCVKYSHLAPYYLFQPVVMETSGVINPNSFSFLRALGSPLAQQSSESKASSYLLQRLSIVVQQGNTAAILGGANRSY